MQPVGGWEPRLQSALQRVDRLGGQPLSMFGRAMAATAYPKGAPQCIDPGEGGGLQGALDGLGSERGVLPQGACLQLWLQLCNTGA